MTSAAVSVVSALLLAGIGGDPGPRFQASVGAGAGYDSNVDLASAGSNVASFGTSTASVWAEAGFAFDLGSSTRLYTGVRYDGVDAFDASDLSYSAFGADFSVTRDLTDWLALIVTPTAGYALYGDPARSAVKASVRASLRAYPWSWLALRAGYERAQTWAADDVFSLGTNRILAGVEARLARRSYLALAYSLSSGDQVFYQPESAVAQGSPQARGAAHRGAGRFATIVPYKAAATENTFSLRGEQGIWKELYFTASYEYTLGSSQEGDYVVHSFFGSVGYRF